MEREREREISDADVDELLHNIDTAHVYLHTSGTASCWWRRVSVQVCNGTTKSNNFNFTVKITIKVLRVELLPRVTYLTNVLNSSNN